MSTKTPVEFVRITANKIRQRAGNRVQLETSDAALISNSNPLPTSVVPSGASAVVQTLRASQALPGSGAFDPSPTEIDIPTVCFIMLYISYNDGAGATNGAMEFKIEWSPYTDIDTPSGEAWFQSTAFLGGNVLGGADTQSLIQRELVEYDPTTTGTETFVYGPLDTRGVVKRIRVAARESGDTSNPGVVEILMVGG